MNYLGHPIEESDGGGGGGGGGGGANPVESVAGIVQVIDTRLGTLSASAGFFSSVPTIAIADPPFMTLFARSVTDNITVDRNNIGSIMVDLAGWYFVRGSMTLSLQHIGGIFQPVVDVTCGFSTYEPGQVVSTWTANAPGHRQSVTVDGPALTFTFSGLAQVGANTVFDHTIQNHAGQTYTFTTDKYELSVVRI